MQNLLEAIQLFGGRLKLEVIKKRTHFQPHIEKAIALHGWLCSSQNPGVRFSWKLQHSACTNIVPSEQRKLSLNVYQQLFGYRNLTKGIFPEHHP